MKGDFIVGIYGLLDRKEGRSQNSICALGFYVWRPQPGEMSAVPDEQRVEGSEPADQVSVQ